MAGVSHRALNASCRASFPAIPASRASVFANVCFELLQQDVLLLNQFFEVVDGCNLEGPKVNHSLHEGGDEFLPFFTQVGAGLSVRHL